MTATSTVDEVTVAKNWEVNLLNVIVKLFGNIKLLCTF